MFLYNESGKKFEIDDSRENMINHGCCGEIYKYKNDCIKLYYGLSLSDGKISKKVFETLKEIDSDYFVKLKDLLYPEGLQEFSAYTMKYYSAEELNILDLDTEYTLYMFHEYLKLFNEFSEKKIIAEDVKRNNTIYDGKNLILIDPDLFYFSNNVEYCKISNYNRLLQLFRSIYLEEVKKILDLDYSKNPFTDLGELFNLEMGPNMDNELSKKLKKYRCPRDYFKSKK